MNDITDTNTSSHLSQIGEMTLQIKQIKCDHENECRKLRAEFGNVIADLHETIFNLRAELNSTERSRRIWKKSHNDIAENRDMWMNEAHNLLEANHLLETNR